jgi:DNA-binding CsgD family transcriptional regulator
VAREVLDVPVAIAVACRLTPRDTALDALLRTLTDNGVLIDVGAFDGDSAVELVRRIAGAEPGKSLLERLEATGGNPLFIVELVTALREDGAIEVGSSGRAEVTSTGVPSSLNSAILRRLSFLSPEASELLGLASVIGSAFSVGDLATATGRRPVELAAPLRETIASGILSDNGEQLAFRHQLIRDALYAELPATLREALHADFARTLLAGGADPTTAAVHLGLAGGGFDIDSARAMRDAAAEVLLGAPAAAVELLEQARSLCPPGELAREVIDTDLAVALLWSGDEAGIELGRRVLEDASAGGDLERLRLAVPLALLERGRVEECLSALDDIVTAPATPRAGIIAEAWRSLSRALSSDDTGAQASATSVLAAAGSEDEDAVCLAHLAMAHVLAKQGALASAVTEADSAVEIALRLNNRSVHEPIPHMNRAFMVIAMGQVEECRRDLEAGRRMCESMGCRMHMPLYDVLGSTVSFVCGEWDRALADCQRALDLASDTGTSWTGSCHALTAMIAIHRGDEATGRAALARAEQEPSNQGIPGGFAMWARALLIDAAEGPIAAAVYLRDHWLEVLAMTTPAVSGASVVRMLLLGGDTETAAAVADVVDVLVEGAPGQPTPAAAARWCRGLVENDADELVAAVEALRASQFDVATAQATEDAACALARAGRIDAARTLARDALDAYEEFGAVRETRRAEQRFRAAGFRLGRRGPRRRAVTGWESLTPTEVQVAELAAAGLTNAEIAERLFVSRHTVHTHVAHVLAKLAVTSRVALANIVADRGPDVSGQPAK